MSNALNWFTPLAMASPFRHDNNFNLLGVMDLKWLQSVFLSSPLDGPCCCHGLSVSHQTMKWCTGPCSGDNTSNCWCFRPIYSFCINLNKFQVHKLDCLSTGRSVTHTLWMGIEENRLCWLYACGPNLSVEHWNLRAMNKFCKDLCTFKKKKGYL